MNEKQNKIKAPRMISVLIAVIFATALTGTIPMLGVLEAKYYSSASGTQTVGGFASFDVNSSFTRDDEVIEWTEDLNLTLKPGDKITYKFTVENHSTVKVRYSVEMTNTSGNITPLVLESQAVELDIGAPEQTLECKIIWPETENDPKYSGQCDLIRLTIRCEQVE